MADSKLSDLTALGTTPADGDLLYVVDISEALPNDQSKRLTCAVLDGRYLTPANNLSDLSNAGTSRTNLGVAIGSDVQAYDATLDAFAAYNTNGLLTQTAADTFAGRTITGTANQITVTDGNGVAGNPTLATPQDIHAAATPVFGGLTINGATVLNEASADADTRIEGNGDANLLFVDAGLDRVGIKTGTPARPLDVNGAMQAGELHLTGSQIAKTVNNGQLSVYGGTSAANAAYFQVSGKDRTGQLGNVVFWANTATAFSGGNDHHLLFGHYNGAGTWSRRMVIDENGLIGVGATNPLAQLHVDQASTTAAIPVLYLDQADVSEEMIEFATTIGVGNAIEAVGAKVLTTTHFIKVTLPGALTRYIPAGTIA